MGRVTVFRVSTYSMIGPLAQGLNCLGRQAETGGTNGVLVLWNGGRPQRN